MAFRGNVLVFFLLGIQQKNCIAVADRAYEKININIAIFFNASDRFLRSIVQNSKDNFLASQQGNNLLNENLTFYDNPWWRDMTHSGRSKIGLNDSLSVVWNISSNIQGAIFVDINSDSIFLSSLLERSGIPTIGAFQRSEQLRTQVGVKVKITELKLCFIMRRKTLSCQRPFVKHFFFYLIYFLDLLNSLLSLSDDLLGV